MTFAAVPDRHIVPGVVCGNEAVTPPSSFAMPAGGDVIVEQSADGCIPVISQTPGGKPVVPHPSPYPYQAPWMLRAVTET